MRQQLMGELASRKLFLLKCGSACLRVGAAVIVLSVAGCADSPNSSYPSLSKITDLGNILTPDEQKKAVEDLQRDGKAQSRDAAKQ